MVVVRASTSTSKPRRAFAADDVVDDAAFLEHLQRAEHRGAADAVLAQGAVDVFLAEMAGRR